MRVEPINFLKDFTNLPQTVNTIRKAQEKKPDFNEILKESMQKTIPHTHPSVFIK